MARLHHPDRAGDDSDTMAALNEAYRVLRHPVQRAAYDAELRRARQRVSARQPSPPSAPAPAPAAPPARVSESGPARYPWKLVLVLAALGIGLVLVGAALFEPAAPAEPDNLLEPGSCVAIEDNGDAREVRCRDSGDDLVVRELVPFDGFCPADLDAHRDRQGRGIACVSPAAEQG